MSVMENHHCALTFAILAKRDCAILSHLEKPLRQVTKPPAQPPLLQTHPPPLACNCQPPPNLQRPPPPPPTSLFCDVLHLPSLCHYAFLCASFLLANHTCWQTLHCLACMFVGLLAVACTPLVVLYYELL